MRPIVWNESLSVHIQEIDLQHRHLIGLVAGLQNALEAGERDALSGVLRELNTYVREHFTAEERWMARYDFPGLAAHADAHEAFVENLLRFELDHLAGQAQVSDELLDYLMAWIVDHVMGMDQRYARFFAEKGVL
ncbi:Bacteriohemerythrin [Fundidesulfovibrio magnetotacticus]|uniref:Bacteriohemerythrin n=1 Tax=Fundidesulfovibrio magnetotacticus TaxID=2730080 RepID=A0A6V8LX74_9BACT|nr:bacteriohemerythrin [Fundidesulfovibrio magnetotacticus]GFK94247.1 Bacteriohemerythrin [Fundidesulfovibrio magnetotacticus]